MEIAAATPLLFHQSRSDRSRVAAGVAGRRARGTDRRRPDRAPLDPDLTEVVGSRPVGNPTQALPGLRNRRLALPGRDRGGELAGLDRRDAELVELTRMVRSLEERLAARGG